MSVKNAGIEAQIPTKLTSIAVKFLRQSENGDLSRPVCGRQAH